MKVKFSMLMFSLVVFVNIMSMSISLKANDEQAGCVYINCPGMVWTDMTPVTTTYMGVTHTIYYKYGLATCTNPNWCEFFIDHIDGWDASGVHLFTPWDWQQIVQAAEMAILNANQNTPCEPQPGECKIQISFSYAACWRWSAANPDGSGHLLQCVSIGDVHPCCIDLWKICRDADNNRTVTFDSHIGENTPCWDGDGNPPIDYDDCFNICDPAPPQH